MTETKPFSSTGNALVDEIARQNNERLSKAVDLIVSDMGISGTDGWQLDFPNRQFVREVPDDKPAE